MSDRGLGRSDWLLIGVGRLVEATVSSQSPGQHGNAARRPSSLHHRGQLVFLFSCSLDWTFFFCCVSHFVELFSVLITLTSPVFLNVPDVAAVTVITACGASVGESAHVTGELLKAAVGVVLWIMSVVSV